MSNNILFYCPCSGTKHYYDASVLGQVSVYQLGSGTRKTMAEGINGSYLRMPLNAINFLFENTMPTTLTIEWWQRNANNYSCVIMPSNLTDGQKLQTQIRTSTNVLTSIYFENRNGNLTADLGNIGNLEWTHVAYTQDYANGRVYCHVNGVYKNSASTNENQYAWKMLCMGAKSSAVNSATEFFGGDIDEVIVTSGAKYPFGQDFTPSRQTPTLTGLAEGGEEETPEQYEYISNITTADTNRLIKACAIKETNANSTIKEWVGTTAEYEALPIKYSDTIYHITDDIGGYASPNVDALISLINTKQDICTQLVDSFDNGSYWYRVWSDGYCEQGGMSAYQSGVNVETVTFLKPYRGVPYISTASVSTGGFSDSVVSIYNLTTTGFEKRYVRNVGLGWSWNARGYLAN